RVLCVFHACLSSLCWAKAQSQSSFSQNTTPGATLNLNCQVYRGSRTLVWYKLDTSRRLQLMASANIITNKRKTLYTEERYSVQSSETSSILSVSNVTWEDAGTYYCGVINEYDVSFGPGTEVVVEGKSKPTPSPLQSVVQSPDYIRVQPNESVTLNCSFHISLCTKDHVSVRWKKKSFTSEILSWSNGTNNIVCEDKLKIGETSCVHKLTLTWKEFSSAEDETYFCVVTACGLTLQGTGTRIYLHNITTYSFYPNATALIWSYTVVGLVVFVLLWGIWRTSNKTGSPFSPVKFQGRYLFLHLK
uniref:Ig-like domain-containing protein n=1 Tax=Periophthalmus magnuspinnatus TaxID=409849 RepID=A0A3B4AXI9_9GOBI